MLWNQTIWSLLLRGGPIMWPILAASVLALALIADRALAHLRCRLHMRTLLGKLKTYLAANVPQDAADWCAKQHDPAAKAARTYLEHWNAPKPKRDAIVQREGGIALWQLEKRQRGLAVLAGVTTLLGLLGTVAGLVGAFHQIELAQGQVQPSDLAAGIWQALLTTVFGLVVAIPSSIAFHFFDARVNRIEQQMQWVVSYLDQWRDEAHQSKTQAPHLHDEVEATPARHGAA